MIKRFYFLSTKDTNIGDEFIRDGIIAVIHVILPKNSWEWKVFNKHKPWTFYPITHPARLAGIIDKFFHGGWHRGLNVLSSLPGNQFFKADVVIQSGTPIIWENAYRSDWAIPFWKRFASKNMRKIPLLNLGGGSCYPWSDPPERLEGRSKEFAKTIVHTSTCITVRDPLAAKLLSEASGSDIPTVPCTAFLAGQYHTKIKNPDGRILFNVMPIGGHFDFLNEINPEAWLTTMKTIIASFQNEYEIEFICHNEKEKEFAEKHWPAYLVHYPKNPKDYFTTCAGATVAVVNRLHAAVGLSGLGIPCIAIGTDTRMLMTRELGITTLFAPEVTAENLISELQTLLSNRQKLSKVLLQKRKKVFENYQTILRHHLIKADDN